MNILTTQPIAHAQQTPEKPSPAPTRIYTKATLKIRSVNVEIENPRLPPHPRTAPSDTIFMHTVGKNAATIRKNIIELATACSVGLSINSIVSGRGMHSHSIKNIRLVVIA